MEICKTIIPAAGLGTRFLPYTKAVPKEMIPILTKPAIHYCIEESLASSLSQFLIITGSGKDAISHHLDNGYFFRDILAERGQQKLLNTTDKLSHQGHYTYINQAEPLGIGHAILQAQYAVGAKEHVGIMSPDDIIDSKEPTLKQLIRIARQEKASVIAVQEVPANCVSHYGIVKIKKRITPNLYQVAQIIEKPSFRDAPSNLAVVGRYVLSSKIFNSLNTLSNCQGELLLSDGISNMIQNNERVFAYKIPGIRYDISTPLGWVKAVIGFALKNPEYAPHIKHLLENTETSQSILYNPAKALEHTL